ncbi:MAG: hypothetical protein L6461_08770 [Anaerolineae bacterium]|nr:hypothetical protein [Anaerolineae bacterium]
MANVIIFTLMVGLAQIDLTPEARTPNPLEYFLGDALGSVHQLIDSTSALTLAKTLRPLRECCHKQRKQRNHLWIYQ